MKTLGVSLSPLDFDSNVSEYVAEFLDILEV